MERSKRANMLAATGFRVAANVKKLRQQQRLSWTELADRMTRLGRPIQPSGVRRIETAVDPLESEKERKPRRVDADDLVALGLALNASPVRLLMPPTADNQEVNLVGDVNVSAGEAWSWAMAEEALLQPDGRQDQIEYQAAFERNSLPPDRQPSPIEAWKETYPKELITALVVTLGKALMHGIPPADLHGLVRGVQLVAPYAVLTDADLRVNVNGAERHGDPEDSDGER